MKKILITAMLFAVAVASSSQAITDSIPKNRIAAGIYGCYGFSGYHSYGGCADITNAWRIWNTGHTSGIFEAGLLAGYQREPFAQSDFILDGASAVGASHRIEGLLTLGTTTFLPPSRRILIGMGIFGGWAHVIMRGSFVNSRYNIAGDYSADKGVWTSGADIHLGVRATDRITIIATALAPLPYAPAPVTSYTIAMIGIAIGVR